MNSAALERCLAELTVRRQRILQNENSLDMIEHQTNEDMKILLEEIMTEVSYFALVFPKCSNHCLKTFSLCLFVFHF